MAIRCWQVDAFTNRPFGENPAAVCWLDHPADDRWMQSVAAEMNLSETALRPSARPGPRAPLVPRRPSRSTCAGHAPLATAHAIWHSKLVRPTSRYGSRPGTACSPARGTGASSSSTFRRAFPSKLRPSGLLDVMGVRPLFAARTQFDFLIALESEEAVRNVRPDYARLAEIPVRGVIVTAASADPGSSTSLPGSSPRQVGVNEDPVLRLGALRSPLLGQASRPP